MTEIFDYRGLVKDINDKKYDIMYATKSKIGLRELSKEIGVSTATLSRIMNFSKMDLETAILICKWLQKPINNYVII